VLGRVLQQRLAVVRRTRRQSVEDAELGSLVFPGHDRVMTSWIAEHGEWEGHEREFLVRTLKPGGTFLNVGANVGYHALFASRLVGPAGRVFAVEPDPAAYRCLLTNLADHGAENVTAIECAAGSAAGMLALYRSFHNAGDNRLTPFEDGASPVKVRVRRLDEVLAGVELDAVLIDTQGWDHEVVAGMGRLLDERPPVLVEFWPGLLVELGVDPVAVVEGYQRLGYDVTVPQVGLAAGTSAGEVAAAVANAPAGFANLELVAAALKVH
jgi:FkbM family methyltransferase